MSAGCDGRAVQRLSVPVMAAVHQMHQWTGQQQQIGHGETRVVEVVSQQVGSDGCGRDETRSPVVDPRKARTRLMAASTQIFSDEPVSSGGGRASFYVNPRGASDGEPLHQRRQGNPLQ